jgi:hypothetical protein
MAAAETDKMAALFESYYGMGDETQQEENTKNVDSVAFMPEAFVRGAAARLLLLRVARVRARDRERI